MTPATGIPPDELRLRRETLLQHVLGEGLTGYVLFDESYIRYFTSFGFLATERPVAFVGTAPGRDGRLRARVRGRARPRRDRFERIESYPEYPGLEHPMLLLARVLRDLGIAGAVGADQDGYPGILGYQGPSLSEVTGQPVDAARAVHREHDGPQERRRGRTDPGERAVVRPRAPAAPGVLRPGATEAEASLRAGHEATLAMLEALGSAVGGQASSDGVSAGYRGQIGLRSSWAHAVAHNIEFREGDVLVTETAAPIWGYNAELERAMIIGTPTDEMRRLFDHTVAAQQVAFDALRPGVTCADVDSAVLRYFEANDLLPYWRQHVGHAIGLRNHEAPFLDVGDHTLVEPGMVFTIEPGLYSSEIGGFRHSDTVVVTPDGIDVLTDLPEGHRKPDDHGLGRISRAG